MNVVEVPLLPTTLVGSWSQPGWLIDRRRLEAHVPVRTMASDLWRVESEHLAEAHADATALAVCEQVGLGLDIVTDGEIRRESYSNRFANALEGIDLARPGTMQDRTGRTVPAPRVVGPLRRTRAVEADIVSLVRRFTSKPIKITLPGPFTMALQSDDHHYRDGEHLALAYAEVVRDEVGDLFAAGADIVQLDEPYLQARPGAAAEYGVAAIDEALRDAAGPTVVHVCFGYGRHVPEKPSGYDFLPQLDACVASEISIEAAQPGLDLEVLDALPSKRIHLGVLDLRSTAIESVDVVADRIRAGLRHLPPERLVVAPDCGCKYLRRDVAHGKVAAMVAAANVVRNEL